MEFDTGPEPVERLNFLLPNCSLRSRVNRVSFLACNSRACSRNRFLSVAHVAQALK